MLDVLDDKQKQRRIIIAALVALLLHLFFFFVAPYLHFATDEHPRTEVVEISPNDLARLKKKILENSIKPALLQQELHKEFESKEAPKDAKFMGPHNQVVPQETVAGAQPNAPQLGRVGPKNTGQERAEQKKKAEAPRKPLTLSDFGLGSKPLPPPLPPEETGALGPKIPRGDDGRPVGREDPNLKKGDDNLLNAVESEYYSFFSRFEEPIVRNWYFLLRTYEMQIRSEIRAHSKSGEGEFPVTIEFVIDRQGNFLKIATVESSQIATLDKATLESVKKLGSLPNPPPGLFKDGNTFSYRLEFMVRVAATPMSDSSPDLRWY